MHSSLRDPERPARREIARPAWNITDEIVCLAEDFAEMAKHGVRHAKYGFGGYAHPRDGEPEVRLAQTERGARFEIEVPWQTS